MSLACYSLWMNAADLIDLVSCKLFNFFDQFRVGPVDQFIDNCAYKNYK